MSTFTNIEEAVLFSESDLRQIFTDTWNEYQGKPGVFMSDLIDSLKANAYKVVGDIAYDRAGLL